MLCSRTKKINKWLVYLFSPQCFYLRGLLVAAPHTIKSCLSPSGIGSVINVFGFVFFFLLSLSVCACWENTGRQRQSPNVVDWQINEVAIGVGSSKGRQEVDCTRSDSWGVCLMGSPNAAERPLLMTCHLPAVWGALPPRFMARVAASYQGRLREEKTHTKKPPGSTRATCLTFTFPSF